MHLDRKAQAGNFRRALLKTVLPGIAPGFSSINREPIPPMNRPARRSANTITGTIEPGARGLILRDAEGLAWRLHFGEEPVPEGLHGQISVRGKIVQPDRIDVEFYSAVLGD